MSHTNQPAAVPAAHPAPADPADPADPAVPVVPNETELTTSLDAAESRLRAAVLRGDVEALGSLLDDHVIYTGPDGRQVSKQQDLDAYSTGAVQIIDYDEQHRAVRVIGSTGLTWVLIEVQGRAGDRPFDARLRYTRTWVYETGWRVVAAHASFVPSVSR